jgi:hypothetical protein
MELVFGVLFVLTIAALVGGAGLMFGRWLAPRFEQLADQGDETPVPEDE